MITKTENNKTILIADDGMFLTDGNVCASKVILSEIDCVERWIEVDHYIEQGENPNTYTAEQLSAMTNAELSAILADMGISGSMTKANMIALILDKQNNIA